ncbi:MAG: 50S ribosomal protein L24 [Anaerolineae bacterium]|nr:50S ribosomal protein L24 [Anaerolineae bacterium]
MQRIKKGDTVHVIAGKDRGERGEVLAVYPTQNRIVVRGVNIVKKHEKARQAGNRQVQAQIVSTEAPLNLSNVMVVCPSCDKFTRIGFKLHEDGFKARVCKKCNAEIDKRK